MSHQKRDYAKEYDEFKAKRDAAQRGTPKDMREAIVRALCLGPLDMAESRLIAAVRDFQAQKFAVAYLNVKTEDEQILLSNLWSQLTGE